MNLNEIICSCKSHIKTISGELVDLEAEHAKILSDISLEIEKVITKGRAKPVSRSNTILKGLSNNQNTRIFVVEPKACSQESGGK